MIYALFSNAFPVHSTQNLKHKLNITYTLQSPKSNHQLLSITSLNIYIQNKFLFGFVVFANFTLILFSFFFPQIHTSNFFDLILLRISNLSQAPKVACIQLPASRNVGTLSTYCGIYNCWRLLNTSFFKRSMIRSPTCLCLPISR